ncbi:MAG: ATP-grasp domain-containing protein [Oscillospiraceae bacterium]|nr:ATP-grasp domain-containing protein [Oscillospiraceae bacterium]
METILFPSSYFSDNKVDEALNAEYQAVIETGLFNVMLFSYDKWFNNGILKLNIKTDNHIHVIYRGWMMKPEQYNLFYNKLYENNIELVTSPEKYELFHIFPNIYPLLKNDTAKMLVYPDGVPINLNEVKQNFTKFMVKDFVKSVKGTSFTQCFDSSVTQAEFDSQMKLFYQYRGNLYTGGICIKEYFNLKKYGTHTNEYRVFYIGGDITTISRNSGQSFYAPLPPNELLEKYRFLNSPYYTIDYAELENGEWKILEAGDGQVSGLSDFQDYNAYFRALYQCLNK